MNRTALAVGLGVTVILIGILFVGLGRDPHEIRSPLVGRQAPTFMLREVGADRSISLESLRGSPVVVNFWATWCVPCLEENAVLISAAQQNSASVQFLGVVFQDEEGKIIEFLRRHGQAYPTLMDQDGKTSIAYGVGGVPETFFIDANGQIVAKYEGAMSPAVINANLAKIRGGVR